MVAIEQRNNALIVESECENKMETRECPIEKGKIEEENGKHINGSN